MGPLYDGHCTEEGLLDCVSGRGSGRAVSFGNDVQCLLFLSLWGLVTLAWERSLSVLPKEARYVTSENLGREEASIGSDVFSKNSFLDSRDSESSQL